MSGRLAEECRKAKETLSTLDKAQLQCPIGPGQEVPYPVDRALLRECAEELLSAVEQLCSGQAAGVVVGGPKLLCVN